MKQQFTGTYTFIPSNGLVSLSGIDLPLERLYLIVNTTRNVPIFNFAVSGLGATRSASSGNTIFDLAFDTSSHDSSDKLTIIYDDGFKEPGVQIGDLLGTVTAIDQNVSSSITLSGFSGWVAMAKLNNNGNGARSVQVEVSSSSNFGASHTTTISILHKGNTYTSFNNFQIPHHSPDYGFFYLDPSSLRYLRVKGLESGGTTECAFYKANLDQAPRGTPLTDTQLRASAVPVSGTVTANVTFPSNQAVNLTDVGGTTATIKGAETASQASDTALVVALHPSSPAMVGQGGSAVSSSNPLFVSLANTGANAAALNVSAAVSTLNPTVASPSLGVTEKRVAASLVQLAATETIPNVTQTNALFVKNVNMVRLSGETFVEERRPDVCVAGEYNGVLQNQLIQMFGPLNASRRIRLHQILFTFRYQGSTTTSDRGIFHFQFYPAGYGTTGGPGNTGTYSDGLNVILKARLLSDSTHTLTFPGGVLAPTVGCSLRVANIGGGAMDINWNITLLEE